MEDSNLRNPCPEDIATYTACDGKAIEKCVWYRNLEVFAKENSVVN
jgi:hypothetical protein